MPTPHGAPRREPPILEIRSVSVRFAPRSGFGARPAGRLALDGVSLAVSAGESVGVVGESGSGKTTLARAALRLIAPESGRVLIDGHDVTDLPERGLRALRRRAQIVFQDPGGSLDPRQRAASIVAEPLVVHGVCAEREALDRARALLVRCGLDRDSADRRPHQFSGGQRQRIAIARAIALRPALLVRDEPTSALDVSVQARILELLEELRREHDLALLFISHDIAVVDRMCERVAVMKDGRIVEQGPREQVLREPREAYTRALIDAVPRMPAASA